MSDQSTANKYFQSIEQNATDTLAAVSREICILRYIELHNERQWLVPFDDVSSWCEHFLRFSMLSEVNLQRMYRMTVDDWVFYYSCSEWVDFDLSEKIEHITTNFIEQSKRILIMVRPRDDRYLQALVEMFDKMHESENHLGLFFQKISLSTTKTPTKTIIDNSSEIITLIL